MSKLATPQKLFEEIHESGTLTEARQAKVWSKMADLDRERLALLFVDKGGQQLSLGDESFQDSFALAGEIAPSSSKMWLGQAEAYLRELGNIRCLMQACQVCEKAASADRLSFEVWYTWARALMGMGQLKSETNYFRDADAKFTQAWDCCQDKEGVNPGFFWDWGLSWYYRGKLSGEAMDYKIAASRYGQAAKRQLLDPKFWNDYGNATVDLGCLVGRYDLLFQAVQLYQTAVEKKSDYFPARLNLACCYQELYEASGAEDFFRSADEAFRLASAINDGDVSLWVKWGVMYLNAGRQVRDQRRLEMALEKFIAADGCEPHSSLVLERWAEAQALLGSMSDNLELLRSAEEKVLEACSLSPDRSHVWYVYGLCLNALGSYFDDTDYYYHAIDRFQYGLSLHPEETKLLHGMGLSYASIGEAKGDLELISQSLDCFSLALSAGEINASEFWNDWGETLMRAAHMADSRPHLEEAVSKFEYAITMQGGDQDTTMLDPSLLYNYGCALDYLGDYTDNIDCYERAIKVLTQVVILDPDYSHARYNLALAWSHLGELTADPDCFDKALDQFSLVLAEDAEDEMAWNDRAVSLMNKAFLLDDPGTVDEVSQLYGMAEDSLVHSIAMGSVQAFYNMACLHSLRGEVDGAIHFLERAEMSGALPALEDMLHDEWLQNIQEDPSFLSFVQHLS